VQLRQQEGTGLGVLDPLEEVAEQAERRRDDTAGRPGVNALLQHVDPDDDADEATQGRGGPELVVGGAAGVEGHDERGRADAAGEGIDVRRQVGAAGLLAALDEHHAPGVAPVVALHGLDGREGGVRGVAVVGATATVEAVAATHGGEGTQTVEPTVHRRLLVEVPVEQDRVVVPGPG
jgi:hypothetical protein